MLKSSGSSRFALGAGISGGIVRVSARRRGRVAGRGPRRAARVRLRSFTKVDGVAQKSLVKLRLSDGARVSLQGQDQRPGQGHGRQRRPALHRRHLQDRQRRGPDRHRRCRQVRHHPRRLKAHRHRQLDLGGRPATRPDRDARPGRQPGRGHRLVDHPATSSSAPRCSPRTCATSTSRPTAATSWVMTTGAYRAGSLCDAAGPSQQPTWVDYTGGDTLSSVAVTGTAVYVGGHQHWMNNSVAGDRAGPGAVAREGIAALDPANSLPWPPAASSTPPPPAPCPTSTWPDRVRVSCAPPRPCSSRDRAAVS